VRSPRRPSPRALPLLPNPLPTFPLALPTPPSPPSPKPAPLPDRGHDAPSTWTPLFQFASRDGQAAVQINGEPAGTTPLSWALAASTCFDPRIQVDAWPPPHAMLASRTSVFVDDGWRATELWITGAKYAVDDREAFRRLHPHLAEDEHVVFVRTGPLQGAFRLRVEGRRFVLHRPAHVNEESEDFQKWNRSLWFERE
jgi:hypothetical protein